MSPLKEFVVECEGKYYSLSSDKEFIVYVRSLDPKKGGKIKLKLPKGSYQVKWYDPVKGDFLPEVTEADGEDINLDLPRISTDVVMYLRKLKEG